MRLVTCALALMASAAPAAAWDINSSESKKAWSYAAFQSDKSGAVELQFFCDESYPEDIQMLVFTDLEADGSEEDFPSVPVTATVGDETFEDLSGYYDEVDGERTVVIDTLEEDRVRDIIGAARDASQPLQVSYDGRSHRFGIDNIAEVLDQFTDGCER
ncbi:MAG TPA: hypothetical protein VIL88_12455 [Devosia sp.]|uniref:hypothetical protein n=1 Tax=Devosia sp. TaxID=1871048 RepID=UPI002F95985D